MSKALQSYLEETLGRLGETLAAGDAGAAWNAAEKGLQMEVAGKILSGRALIALREQLPPGDFASGLAQRNIPRSSAYRAIEIYEIFAAVNDLRAVPALAQLGETKVLALSGWTPKELETFGHGKEVRGITIDQTIEMSSRDLVNTLRTKDDEIGRLEGERESLKCHLNAARSQVEQLKTAAVQRALQSQLPDFAFAARQETAAASDQVDLGLDLIDDVLLGLAESAGRDRVHAGIAVGAVVHLLNGAAARIQKTLGRLQKAYPGEFAADPSVFAFKPAEVEAAIAAREVLLGRTRDAQHDRAAERANSRDGRVGRKRKTTAEKKGR